LIRKLDMSVLEIWACAADRRYEQFGPAWLRRLTTL
jgi:hypothetical protein